jgi:hypothetical protein
VLAIGACGFRNLTWIEPWALVSDYDGDSASRLAATRDMDMLSRIHSIPVNDRIGHSFKKGQFDLGLFARNATRQLE